MVEVTRQLQVVGEDEAEGWLKVAFATTDREVVNQHFGSALAFTIYGVNPERHQLLSVAEFSDDCLTSDDKLLSKMSLLEGCVAVFCRACGASAANQLLQMGVKPVKVAEGSLISELLDGVREELKQGPSSWLAQAIQQNKMRSLSTGKSSLEVTDD